MDNSVSKQTSGYGWVILAVVFISGFTAPANLAKVPAIPVTLMTEFGIGPSEFGLLISSFFLLGFILAFPAAGIIGKIGLKSTIVIAILCGALGSVVGAVTTGFVPFVVGRLIEGAGMGIMGVAGASAIAPWFPKEKRGLPLGIWAVWVALGMVLCPLIFSNLEAWAVVNGMDFRVIWWVTAVFDIVVLILFLLLYRTPQNPYDDADLEAAGYKEGEPIKATSIFRNVALVGLGAIFLFDCMVFMTINGFFVDYQVQTFGYDQIHANIYVTAFAVTGAIFAIVAGKISDVLKTRKWVLFVGLCAGTLYTAVVFVNQIEELYWLISIIAGMTGGMVPSMIWISVPETVPGKLVPLANAFVAATQNLGMFIGPLFMGIGIAALGYTTAALAILFPLYFICLIVWFFTIRKRLR